MKPIRLLYIPLAFFLLSTSCKDEKKKQQIDYQQLQEDLIEANKSSSRAFSDSIDNYIQSQGWKMKETGTGLRYMYLKEGEGDSAEMGMMASVFYEARMLDGTQVYASTDKPESFMIGRADVVSGMHQGVAMMREGDKMRFVMPPHLAYGLTGDNREVPPNTPMIYVVELVEVGR